MVTPMKLNGNSIARATRNVTIERTAAVFDADGKVVTPAQTLTFCVSSLSIGIRREFDVMYPTPMAPKITTEGKNGRTEKEIWDDPKFMAAVDERAHLRNVYILYRILANDPNVSFENVPTDVESLRKLAVELTTSGLSEGDMIVLLKEALRASNLTQEEIALAKANF